MDIIIYILVAALVLCGLVYLLWRKMIHKYKHFKFNPTVPLFGHVLGYPVDDHDALMYNRDLWRKFGSQFIIWVGPKPILFCSDANWVEALMKSQTLIVKSDFYSHLHDWLGNGLLISTGAKWRSRRKLITPAFHFSILKDFLPIFNEQSLICVNGLDDYANSGESFDIQSLISSLTLDVICEAAMGVKISAQTSAQSEYVNAVKNLSKYLLKRTKSPWLWPNFMLKVTTFGKNYYKALDIIHSFTRKVILSRVNDQRNVKRSRQAFLDILLDASAKGEIDLDGIQEEVDTFMFEGHDTTSSSISWTLYLLSLHPEVQEKVQQEIDTVWQSDQSLDVKISELKYLECVIKEVLRLYPPVTVYGREMREDTLIEGSLVPKGTQFMVFTYGLHMDTRYWVDPEKFIPERFMGDEALNRHPFQYLPFAAGPRNCIGQKFALMEEKVILFNLLRKFKFTSKQTHDQMRLLWFVLHSSNGIWLSVTKRSLDK